MAETENVATPVEGAEVPKERYVPARRFYGRPPVAEAQATIFHRLAPLHDKMGWKESEFARQITRMLRRLTDREDNAKKIVFKWDHLPRHYLTKPHSIDEVLAKLKITNDELCRLVFVALTEETRERVDAMRLAALPGLVEKSLEAAKGTGVAAATERKQHLIREGVLPARGQGRARPETRHPPKGEDVGSVDPTSFDEQLAELDVIEADTEIDIFGGENE